MYKILLIFGISLLFFSCEKTDGDGAIITYYKYKNATNQNIELIVNNIMTNSSNTYVLNPNQEKTFESICKGEGEKGLCSKFSSEHKIVIKFISDNKCLVDYPKLLNELEYDNYTNSMNNQNENSLLYLIDAEEVAAATVCN